MMFLRADFADLCDCDYSIYVTFNYNPNYVSLIKQLKIRAWNKTNSWWEVPYSEYTPLITLLNQYGISYNAQEFMQSIQTLSDKVAKMQELQKTEHNVDASCLDSVDFKTNPFHYQREGIAYGLSIDKFLLADTPGLGKTLMSANIARLKRGGKHCLIICGYKSLLFNWVSEIEKHTTEKAYVLGQRITKRGRTKVGKIVDRLEDIKNLDKIEEFFVITDVTTLRQSEKEDYIKKNGKKAYNKNFYIADLLEEQCRNGEIGRIIVDESHVCANAESDQTQALLRLKSCPYKIAMTGTPIMNKNLDIFPIMKWLGYETRNFWAFREHYCKLGGYQGKQVIGNKNNEELHKRVSQFMLRRFKEDVLDLPEKIIIDEYLEMDGKQYSLYEKYNKLTMAELAKKKNNRNELLSALTLLRKITCHPGWVDPAYTESVKYERAKQIIAEAAANDEKTIIVSNWTTPFESEIECINLAKELAIYNPAMITGNTKDRQEQIEKFQTDPTCKVFIGSIKAMGVGITLNAAANVIFLDEPWNKAIKDQCTDRAHRVGTKHSVKVYTLICRNTKDEGVHNTVYKKGRLADEIVDGVSPEELQNIIEKY